jgi:hypothetical protein
VGTKGDDHASGSRSKAQEKDGEGRFGETIVVSDCRIGSNWPDYSREGAKLEMREGV